MYNHCQCRCCARLISLYLGIRNLDANSYIAEWHAHGLHLDVVLRLLHHKVTRSCCFWIHTIFEASSNMLHRCRKFAFFITLISTAPRTRIPTIRWPDLHRWHVVAQRHLLQQPGVHPGGCFVIWYLSTFVYLPTWVNTHWTAAASLHATIVCVCVRAHAGECKRTLSGKWGISETLFCVCFSMFSFFQLPHRWQQALYQIHFTAYQLKQTNPPSPPAKSSAEWTKMFVTNCFPSVWCLTTGLSKTSKSTAMCENAWRFVYVANHRLLNDLRRNRLVVFVGQVDKDVGGRETESLGIRLKRSRQKCKTQTSKRICFCTFLKVQNIQNLSLSDRISLEPIVSLLLASNHRPIKNFQKHRHVWKCVTFVSVAVHRVAE